MRTTHPELTAREVEAVLARRLAQITPPQQPVRPPGVRPMAVLIGGTPGTGKSTIQWLVQDSLGADTVAVYDYDDDAAAHPRYDAIMRSHGLRGADVVAESIPSNLKLSCLKHLRGGDPKYDVIASAPLHDEDTTKTWADGFHAVDYRVALVYVITNEANSMLGRASRYQQARDDTGIGRWVVDPALCIRTELGIPDTAHALEEAAYVDDLYIVDRNGYVLYENHRGDDGRMPPPLRAREQILAERNRPPTPAEHEQFLATALPLLERRDGLLTAVADLVQAAWDKHTQRPAPQSSARDLSTGNRLGQRLIDLRQIAGSGLAPPYSITPPPPTGPGSARGGDGRRAVDGTSRDR